MRRLLFHFSQAHENFRSAEWRSACRLAQLEKFEDHLDQNTDPLVLLDVESIEEVQPLLDRLILLKSVYEVIEYNDGDHDSMCKWLAQTPVFLEEMNKTCSSWCLRIRPVGKKRSGDYVNDLLERYATAIELPDVKVDLRNPEIELSIIEDVNSQTAKLRHVYLVRFVGNGQSAAKSQYSLKTRIYIGNSTMDPELALLQSSLSMVREGSLVCDPFCGTGGLLVAAAHFGGLVVGTEINYQVARAKGRSSRQGEGELRSGYHSIAANFAQYNLLDRFLGIVIADASKPKVWRSHKNALFDVIVADPPYGVREKGSKLGIKERKPDWLDTRTEKDIRLPEKTKYKISSTYLDLMNMSASLLTVGGRVSFWYPILRDRYSVKVLPSHPVLKLIANCEQTLTLKCSRRLLVYQKTREPSNEETATIEEDCFESSSFRDAIFTPA
ncbi:TRNA (guanine(10)-N2)-methyltransferase-like protein [Aphelenchoides besseyi]|nr:TRNA (guanine(10)-N2)-methyltransferase-like protein [Aphelenchoides besseyi]